MSKILITGVAGFVAYHLAERLLTAGHEVVGIDNLNNYYDVKLKQARLAQLTPQQNFHFELLDLANAAAILQLFKTHHFDLVINLAAQPGVRYSLENPQAYIDSNIIGFFNILEACRQFPPAHLLYASSSSVYGGNKKLPFSTDDNVDHPLSLYAATKKSNELMAHCYAHLYHIPCTGLRFFTVYGPWGRPDMAMFSFTHDIFNGNPIKVYNYGNHYRDFTYIDDITESMYRLLNKIPDNTTPWRIFNIGNQQPVHLLEYLKILEKHTGKTAIIELVQSKPGDMLDTHADISDLIATIDYTPRISIDEGVRRFVAWYKHYYQGVV